MSDALADLTAQGVSIWLDDISRERLLTGNLQNLVDEKHVVGVTSNPTIFQKAMEKGHVYDDQIRDLAVRGVSLEEAVRLLTSYDIRWGCDVLPTRIRSDWRRGRPGVHRGRSAHCLRDGEDHSRGEGTMVARRPPERADQDPRDRAGAPIDCCGYRRRGQRQHHADLLSRPLRRRHGRLPHRLGAGARRWDRPVDDPIGRFVLRVPRRHRDRQATGQDRDRRGAAAAGQGRHRQCAGRLSTLREGVLLRPVEGPRGTGRKRRSGRCGPRRASRIPPTTTRCTWSSWSRRTRSTQCRRLPSTLSRTMV